MNNHRLHTSPAQAGRDFKKQITQIIVLVTSYLLIVTLTGCEVFVRKFTRKPKKEKLPKEEMVVAPQEYKGPLVTKEELYRQYFLYWKTWHDELIGLLVPGANHKKQIDCIGETIKNLEQLRTLLNQEKQKKLDIYINQLKDLKNSITTDIYGNSIVGNRLTAERIKRNILRDFAYNKISKDISYGAS